MGQIGRRRRRRYREELFKSSFASPIVHAATDFDRWTIRPLVVFVPLPPLWLKEGGEVIVPPISRRGERTDGRTADGRHDNARRLQLLRARPSCSAAAAAAAAHESGMISGERRSARRRLSRLSSLQCPTSWRAIGKAALSALPHLASTRDKALPSSLPPCSSYAATAARNRNGSLRRPLVQIHLLESTRSKEFYRTWFHSKEWRRLGRLAWNPVNFGSARTLTGFINPCFRPRERHAGGVSWTRPPPPVLIYGRARARGRSRAALKTLIKLGLRLRS